MTVIHIPQGKHQIPPAKLIKAFLGGMQRSRGIKRILSRPVSLNGYSGTDTRMDFENGNMTWERTFAVHNTIYQVAAESSPPHLPMPRTKAILDSMRFPKLD